MTVPDELVRAAAEAIFQHHLKDSRPGALYPIKRGCSEVARVALQAAFAKLPECEAAVQVAAGAVTHRPTCAYQIWNRAIGGTGRCDKGCTDSILAALAREFGSRDGPLTEGGAG